MSAVELTELVPAPAEVSVFARPIRPEIADATGSGRVRLDAIARWLQDVAYLELVTRCSRGAGRGWCGGPGAGWRGFRAPARTSSCARPAA